MGRDVEPGPVFYLAGEGHAGLSRRLRAWELHHETALADAPLFVSQVPAALIDVQSAVNVEAAITGLESIHGKPALIIIDTFARNLGAGDENSNADIGLFINHLDQMRLRLGCAVLLVHHSGHVEKDRARGGSALNAAMDASFQLDKKSGQRGDGFIELTHRKAKESELCMPQHFELLQVRLDGWRDAKGRDMHSAVLVQKHLDESEIQRGKPLTLAQRQGMDAFVQAAVEAGGEGSEGSEGSEGAGDGNPVKPVHIDQWRNAFYRNCDAKTPEARKTAFLRVRKALVELGQLVQVNDTHYAQSTPDAGL